MIATEPAQNSAGGEVTQMNEIKLGDATYLVQRTFSEDRTVSDLIVDRLVHEKKEKTSFDEGTDDAV